MAYGERHNVIDETGVTQQELDQEFLVVSYMLDGLSWEDAKSAARAEVKEFRYIGE